MAEGNFWENTAKDFIPSLFWLRYRLTVDVLGEHDAHRVEKMFGNIGIRVSSGIICEFFIHNLCLTTDNIASYLMYAISTCHEAN